MCPCGTGHANFEHIMWDCPHVDFCRTLRNPDDFGTPSQMCAIPIMGCPPQVQDALAKQAMQTLMAWKQLHAKNGSHDDDGDHDPHESRGDNDPRASSVSLPPDEDGPPEGWRAHPKATCLWLSPDGLRIMCTKCRTQARSDGYARHIGKHAQCNYAPRVTPSGRVPKGLPQHLTWTKGDDGVRHIHCLRCCARAHYTKHSIFVKRHELCVDLSSVGHARPDSAPTASALSAMPAAPEENCDSWSQCGCACSSKHFCRGAGPIFMALFPSSDCETHVTCSLIARFARIICVALFRLGPCRVNNP